jgi:DNA-binding transcriptional ArsR family regulator
MVGMNGGFCGGGILAAMAGKPLLPLDPEALAMVAARFKALAEPLRLRMLQELQARGEASVTELAEAVASTQPNVSKHLRILQDHGLVGRRQEGNTVYCFIADPSVAALCDVVCGSIRERLENQARVLAPPRRRNRRK